MSQKSGPGWVRGTGRRDCPVGYPVKGNEPSNVYYEPGDPGYPQVIPEMCFDNAETAQRVGFTAVKGGGGAAEAVAAAVPAGFMRATGGRECPSGFPIKGNEPSNIFYRPEDPGYAQVVPEVCFADVSEAEKAGFTRVKVEAAKKTEPVAAVRREEAGAGAAAAGAAAAGAGAVAGAGAGRAADAARVDAPKAAEPARVAAPPPPPPPPPPPAPVAESSGGGWMKWLLPLLALAALAAGIWYFTRDDDEDDPTPTVAPTAAATTAAGSDDATVAAGGDATVEAAGTDVAGAAGTAGAGVAGASGTVEAAVANAEGTVEAAAGGMDATAEAAASAVEGTAEAIATTVEGTVEAVETSAAGTAEAGVGAVEGSVEAGVAAAETGIADNEATVEAAIATGVASPEASPEASAVALGNGINLIAKDIAYEPNELTIQASDLPVTIMMENTGAALHDFSIDSLDILVAADPGETVEIEIPAGTAPGTYEYYCTVPGHKEAGMVGTLVVE